MKKTILILAILLSSITATAQSDATLQETVQWLNTYGTKNNEHIKSGLKFFITMDVTMENNQPFFSFDKYVEKTKGIGVEECWDNSRTEFYLSDIKRILIDSSSKNYYVKINTKDNIIDPCGKKYVFFKTKKQAMSLFKALKHLNSFFDNDIVFEDIVSLENKF